MRLAYYYIRDGDRGGRGRESEGSIMDIARRRPERPWTAARTMEVLRWCPLAIAQRLVHRAIAVTTAVLGSHKDNVRCTAVEEQPKAKEVQLSQPSSTPLFMISSGLTWGSSSTSLLLTSLLLMMRMSNTDMGGGDSSVVKALDSWLKSCGFESLQELQGTFCADSYFSIHSTPVLPQ